MRTIRGGKGLGDALYVQAVARYFVGRGEQVRVATTWPDVFRPLNGAVQCIPFTRAGIDTLAHYSRRKAVAETNQFRDCCIEAGVNGEIDLRLDWKPQDAAIIRRVHETAAGRPVVLVGLPRAPMGRSDGFGQELLPNCHHIQRAIDCLRGRVCLVQIGAGAPQFKFRGLDLDLANATTVEQMIDLASAAAGFLGYVSFILPLAESLGKPALMVWSTRGLKSKTTYIRQITPAKVIHRSDLVRVVLDSHIDGIDEVAHGFLR